jgi:MHS family proline/betaine transporter-like MFS transporter
VLVAATLWLVVLVHPLVWLIQTQHALASLIVTQTLLCMGVGCFVGVAPAALAEMFPAQVRSTGVSVCYNLAVTIFSGFAPAVLAFLTGRGGVFAPGWYVIIAAVLAAPALVTLKPGRKVLPAVPEPSPWGA